MATRPLQDDPSGSDIEHSERENIQELRPILILRTAKSLILPLRIPDQWEVQPFVSAPPTRSIGASPVVAFKATTHVLDPGTQRTHTLTLSMGPSIDDGSANLFLQSDSIRNEGNWRADLYRGTDLRASVPFADGYEELYRGLPAGIYTVKLTSAGDRAGQGHGIEGMGKVPGYRARPLEGAWRNFRRVTETARSVASVPSVPKSRKNS